MPLVGQAMYTNLKPQIATTILAGVAALVATVPLFLLRYGDRLRSASKIAQQIAREEAILLQYRVREADDAGRHGRRKEEMASSDSDAKLGIEEKTAPSVSGVTKAADVDVECQ